MTNSVVSPVIPSGGTGGRVPGPAASRRTLPVARLAPARAGSRVYGLASIDCNGRVAEASVIRALGWAPGIRLDIREDDGLVLVEASRRGVFGMTGQGCLRVPAAVRHWCGLVPGDRVLLAADPGRGRLVVYPPAVLDEMVAQFHEAVWGGEAV